MSDCNNSYLIKVLTFDTLMSYNFFTASLIEDLFERISTINTSVLFSSIFFIDDSVVSGYLIIENWSSLLVFGADFLGYKPALCSLSVFGRWKCTEVRTLVFFTDFTPFAAAFLAFKAWFLAWLALPVNEKDL